MKSAPWREVAGTFQERRSGFLKGINPLEIRNHICYICRSSPGDATSRVSFPPGFCRHASGQLRACGTRELCGCLRLFPLVVEEQSPDDFLFFVRHLVWIKHFKQHLRVRFGSGRGWRLPMGLIIVFKKTLFECTRRGNNVRNQGDIDDPPACLGQGF